MNPWIIVSWIGAICTAAVILACTVSVVVNLIRPRKNGRTKILSGTDR